MGGLCRGIVVASAFVGRRGSAVLDEMVDEIASLRWRVQELRVRLSAAEGLLGIGAFTATPTQSIEWLSPHAVELFGSDSADLLGGNWLARIDDESRDAIESAWSLACSKRIATSCAVVTIGGRNLRISLNPSVDTAGQVVSVYGRVTEQK
jgi:PAS domain-containing protein